MIAENALQAIVAGRIRAGEPVHVVIPATLLIDLLIELRKPGPSMPNGLQLGRTAWMAVSSLEAALANAITPYPRPTVPASEVSYGR